MLRQTRLLSLETSGWSGGGASDGLLQAISRLSHLTRLDCALQAGYLLLAGVRPPIQLEPATDSVVQCLSSLQSLQNLSLTVGRYHSTVTGQALNSIGALHQLTHLCLRGWPMVDTDPGHLTHLQLLSLDLTDCLKLTPGCLIHEMTLFTGLHSLTLQSMDYGQHWGTCQEFHEFEELARRVMPYLTTLKF